MAKVSEIYAVELSSRCQLSCPYCPQPAMKRAKLDMPDDVVTATYHWLKHFRAGGRQREVHLHNFGESLLHPKVVEIAARISTIVPDVHISTNGIPVNPMLARELHDAGIRRISVSPHRPNIAAVAKRILEDAGLVVSLADGFIRAPHDWAGRVSHLRARYHFPCIFLQRGRAVILADGTITMCCIDAEGEGRVGNILTDELDTLELGPVDLCALCHHTHKETADVTIPRA